MKRSRSDLQDFEEYLLKIRKTKFLGLIPKTRSPEQMLEKAYKYAEKKHQRYLESLGTKTPCCPYCGYEFERMPLKKRICPQC